MADPRALQVAVAAAQALELIGLPEAQYALAEATIVISVLPHSTAAGRAYFAARDDVLADGILPVPGHLRSNSRTYRHPDDWEDGWTGQRYLPDRLAGRRYYVPSDAGQEPNIAARMAEREARKTRPPRKKR